MIIVNMRVLQFSGFKVFKNNRKQTRSLSFVFANIYLLLLKKNMPIVPPATTAAVFTIVPIIL
jgi:hypothetical protein